ncbi:MAG: translation elongation factor Ts [Alphaproteobacteria bacterium]|nr:translation elongation factor Ts [Alphaproteobacteria bacterium]
MADITATMVKDLREKTGAGMLDCRNALNETKGDMEAAIDALRKKGLSKAAKKASNVAAEGLVGVIAHGGSGAVVEVNSQTDFVARNPEFQDLVSKIAGLAPKAEGNRDKLAQSQLPGTAGDVDARIKALAGTIGENIVLRRTASLHVSPGLVASYIHNQAAPGLGRLGVLVALKSTGNPEKLAALGRQIAMHIAGTPTPPLALRADQIDPAVAEREKAIFADQARATGKPENIIAKMVEGRMRKFYEEVVLPHQPFVMDPEKTVEAFVKAAEATVGAPISIEGFVRFALGEGIQKEETDFAAEVAAAAKS